MKNIFNRKNQFIIWACLGVFLYTLIIAFIFQKFVFPRLESLSTHLGLLKGDNALFHELASKMAKDILTEGWSAWKLFPHNFAAGINVGVLAVIYVFLGFNPLYVLPINALLQTLSFLMLYKIFLCIDGNKLKSIFSALVFVVLPSTILWISQVHKDSYAILAWNIIFYSIVLIKNGNTKKVIIVSLIGVLVMAISRPLYLNLVVLLYGLIFLVFLISSVKFIQMREGLIRGFILIVLSSCMSYTVFHLINSSVGNDEYFFTDAEYCPVVVWDSGSKNIFPQEVDNKLRAMAGIRSRLLCHQPEGTTSSIDLDFKPSSSWDMLGYLPRSIYISLFYPTPVFLLKIFSIKALPILLEMLLFYLAFPFSIWYLIKSKNISLYLIVGGVLVCVVFLSYINPNMGTFHRIRFPFFSFILGLGFLGFFNFFKGKK